jgi:membrane associated rhomboid family serine protease
MSYTIIIIVITALISIAGFNNAKIINKLILWPKKMDNPAEYYRLLTSGFIHNDWNHLIFNMFTLYFFGSNVQMIIDQVHAPGAMFLLLYLSGIVIASLPTFLKNRHNSYYRSLGASGGVASILFFTIYFFPWSRINILFIPIGIPAIVFGGLYLAYEAYMAKRGAGNVNHDAHFWGSVYGLFFAFILDPSHGAILIDQITHPH